MHYGPNCWALIVATLCAYELLPLKMFPTIEKTEFNDKFVKFAITFLRHFVWNIFWEKHFNPLSCLLYFSEIFVYVNRTWYRNIVLSIIFHYPFFFWNDQVWEIVDTTHEKLNKEIVYKFVNRWDLDFDRCVIFLRSSHPSSFLLSPVNISLVWSK